MERARLDGLVFLLLGIVMFMLLGLSAERSYSVPAGDFRVVYYPAKCLIQHCDPYNESEVLRIYRAEGAIGWLGTEKDLQTVTRYLYPPTAFAFTTPFAMLPWGPAHTIWLALTVGSLAFASFLIWDLGADYAPVLSGVLIAFVLANSEVIVAVSNAAGIAIGLCAVAVWCFIRNRFVLAGILCLAISLALKPHDAGLVWLYFLLAGGVYRRRALQTLVATVALSLPGVLWVWHVAPFWLRELNSNVLAFAAAGGQNDPGQASTGAFGNDMLVSLQMVFSGFRDDPRFYNPASYLTCALLLLVLAFATLRFRPSRAGTWLAIAAIAALSMLPVYHRLHDTKLLLLTVPACAMLWAEGGMIGWLALLVNSAGFVLTADVPGVILLDAIRSQHAPAAGLSAQMLTAAQRFPVPLILLIVSIFYLWIYVQRTVREAKLDASGRKVTQQCYSHVLQGS